MQVIEQGETSTVRLTHRLILVRKQSEHTPRN